MKRVLLPLLLVFLIKCSLFASTEVPFSKGVNFSAWFQAGSAQEINFTKHTKQDFINVKSLGCDAIRLPINLHSMTNGAPDYTLDPIFLSFLDQVVDWAEELELHLILDNHTFSVVNDTDPNIGDVLVKVWPQMAQHLNNTSERIYFEVLNEPHGIDDQTWNDIQIRVVEAIREVDTKHTIVVGPADWNSFNSLDKMPIYDDDNLIYTFHFYDPFLFTHQGASWTGMSHVADIPFPYDENKMPDYPVEHRSHWSYNSYKGYHEDGTVENIYKLIDIAVKFQQERNVPIWCGEFGVYDINSPDADRTYWYEVVGTYLTENNIAWTVWDYTGAFGIFEKGGNDMFNHDLHVGVCEALGLTPPEQTEFIVQPDSVGFEIFTDYAGANINYTSSAEGETTFYSDIEPNNGNTCIQWANANQYNQITFNFSPTKDINKLVEEGYALDMLIRSTDPNGNIDIRFVDTNTGEDDKPWRNRVTLNKSNMEWTGSWQHLHIPLSDFIEQGAWEGTWHNPEGLFDWSAIDKFEIVAEAKPMGNHAFWFDNIVITNQDTAKVYNTAKPAYEPTVEIIDETQEGFIIFDDEVSNLLELYKNTSGNVNENSIDYPANGANCIAWSDEPQYKSIDFNFKQVMNFNYLVENDYALDLFVRSSHTDLAFDIRFVDSNEEGTDHPWRMGTTINSSLVEWNDEWQHIHLPLNSLSEMGSWDEAWYDPNNLFDWKAVDKFQIATERMGIDEAPLFIDDITVTNKDTSSVHNIRNGILTHPSDDKLISITYNKNSIVVKSLNKEPLLVRIHDVSGKTVVKKMVTESLDIKSANLRNGIYVVQASSKNKIQIEKIILR